jgi:hypothetical protein
MPSAGTTHLKHRVAVFTRHANKFCAGGLVSGTWRAHQWEEINERFDQTYISTQAQYTDGTIKIGVMNDMSGLYSDISGRGSVVAARMESPLASTDDCVAR